MRKFFYVTALLLLSFSLEGVSQSIGWKVDANSFFDNAEFAGSDVAIPQTMGGIHFSPQVVFTLDTVHSIIAGVDLLSEFGEREPFRSYTPIIYYHYGKGAIDFSMGSFPAGKVRESFPRSFFRDSVAYYRPNMSGFLFEYQRDRFDTQLWLDWTGRQTFFDREAFFVGIAANYRPGVFYLKDRTLIHHYAQTSNPSAVESVFDNILMVNSVGVDVSGKTFLDLLDVNVGWLVGIDRDRSTGDGWVVNGGLLSEITLEYKFLGLFNTLYYGGSQMDYYDTYSYDLYWGDPFYRLSLYDRSDIYVNFLKGRSVSIKLVYSLHFCEKDVYHQQMLNVSIDFGKL